MIKIGILAVQGAFIEHQAMLKKLGVQSFEIRQEFAVITAYGIGR